ncbi:hypothetical protein M422DRAFT_244710 [Sphaerobolus stellatus SS14]|nr:hypothetical protein M422DRAFT_244710 [Sphaerobolus stellatus SS14]
MAIANKLTASLVLLCLFINLNVIASPVDNVVEVIPGPGLPSLESLGLTSAALFKKSSITAGESLLTKHFDTTCQTFNTVSAANAEACVNFLRALGQQACAVNGDNSLFCTAGDANIFGSNISGGPSASSFCSDVAIGAQNILNACTLSNGQVEGAAAANGNGFLVVSIEPAEGA